MEVREVPRSGSSLEMTVVVGGSLFAGEAAVIADGNCAGDRGDDYRAEQSFGGWMIEYVVQQIRHAEIDGRYDHDAANGGTPGLLPRPQDEQQEDDDGGGKQQRNPFGRHDWAQIPTKLLRTSPPGRGSCMEYECRVSRYLSTTQFLHYVPY